MARKKKQNRKDRKPSALTLQIPAACHDEKKAVELMEQERWPDGVVCPHCGAFDTSYAMKDRKTGERNRRWLWRCGKGCKRQFTWRVGTVMQDSRLPARHWVMAFWLMCSSKKGCSALQLQRQTGMTYKSALFLAHRVREAMAEEPAKPEKLSGTVEVDETYVGGRYRGPRRSDGYTRPKKAVALAMLERGGEVRTKHVPPATKEHIYAAIRENIDMDASRLVTDELNIYRGIGKEFAGGHETVKHGDREYAREPDITTNTVEGFFSLVKRSISGVHHHVSRKHLRRYLGEREFVYNARKMTDGERTALAIRRTTGKRLRYDEQVG